jgi:hypothetical protein
VGVHGPAGNFADHGLRRKIVTLYQARLARLAGQKGDEWAQHFPDAPEPLARDLDDRMRPTGFAQLIENETRFPVAAHKSRRASIRSEGVPERQRPLFDGLLAGRDRNQIAGRQERKLGASLDVYGVKLADHQVIVGRPALRRSTEFGDHGGGDRPFAAKRGANLLSRQRRRSEPHRL